MPAAVCGLKSDRNALVARVADVPLGSGETSYQRRGDVFRGAAGLILSLLGAASLGARPKISGRK